MLIKSAYFRACFFLQKHLARDPPTAASPVTLSQIPSPTIVPALKFFSCQGLAWPLSPSVSCSSSTCPKLSRTYNSIPSPISLFQAYLPIVFTTSTSKQHSILYYYVLALMRIAVRTARRYLIPSEPSESKMTGDGGAMMLMSRALASTGTLRGADNCCRPLPFAIPPYPEAQQELGYQYRRIREEKRTKEDLKKHVIELETNLMPHM